MPMIPVLVALALVKWIVTEIVTRGYVFHLSRDWLENEAATWDNLGECYGRTWQFYLWDHLSYLHKCHLCAGMWISILIGTLYALNAHLSFPLAILTIGVVQAIGHWIYIAQRLVERWS